MQEITTELLLLLVPIIIVEFVLILISIRDWIKQGTGLENRYMWLLVIVFVSTIGPIIYFLTAPREKKDDFLNN